VNLLSAYHDAVELRERLTALIASVTDEEQRQLMLLHCVNGYYDQYLCMNAPMKVHLAEATIGDIMARIPNKGESVSCDVSTHVQIQIQVLMMMWVARAAHL
jgi:hypothetical protein